MIKNRKDCTPHDTIERIKHILLTLGIEVNLIGEINNNNHLFSCRVEFAGLAHVGSNGKGISSEFSQASAYAELMERLQTGMLLDGRFIQKRDKETKHVINKINVMNVYKKHLDHVFNSQHDFEYLSSLIDKDASLGELSAYFSTKEKEVFLLPDKFISIMCGSNGLASGNSLEEAYTQGICEVFERYVTRLLYSDSVVEFPDINESFYRDSSSYILVDMLKKKGYEVIVKDCTLDGQYPVLGIIIFSQSRTKYKVKLASDIDFDICLQRCLTEITQGFNFLTLKLNMNHIEAEHNKFWYLKDNAYEFHRFFVDGTGKIPRHFLKRTDEGNPDIFLKPFKNDCLCNSEAFKALHKIILSSGRELFMKDFSHLGFPTIRAYIPGMSEVADIDILQIREMVFDIHNTFKEIKSVRDRDLLSKLFYLLKSLLSKGYLAADSSIDDLRGIIKTNKDQKSIYHFTAELALFIGCPEEAYRLISSYYQSTTNLFALRIEVIEKTVIEAIIQGVQKNELVTLLNTISTGLEKTKADYLVDYYYDICNGKWTINLCDDCNVCTAKGYCCFAEWEMMYKKVQFIGIQKDIYNDLFYKEI